jgi:hypothetical protein
LAVLLAIEAVDPVIASNLSFGSGAFGLKLQWLTWSRQLPFGPGMRPYPASYAGRLLKEAVLRPGFLWPFGLPAFAS